MSIYIIFGIVGHCAGLRKLEAMREERAQRAFASLPESEGTITITIHQREGEML